MSGGARSFERADDVMRVMVSDCSAASGGGYSLQQRKECVR